MKNFIKLLDEIFYPIEGTGVLVFVGTTILFLILSGILGLF